MQQEKTSEKLLNVAKTLSSILAEYGVGKHGSSLNRSASPRLLSPSPTEVMNQYMLDYEEATASLLEDWLLASEKIGEPIVKLSKLVAKVYMKQFCLMTETQRPSNVCMTIVRQKYEELNNEVVSVSGFQMDSKNVEYVNHMHAVYSAIHGFLLMLAGEKMRTALKNDLDSINFYTDKIVREYKNKDQNHVQWAQCWLAFWKVINEFVVKSPPEQVIEISRDDYKIIERSESLEEINSVSLSDESVTDDFSNPPHMMLLDEILENGKVLGEDVSDASILFVKILNMHNDFVKQANNIEEPKDSEKSRALFEPIRKETEKVMKISEKVDRPLKDHILSINSCLQALCWMFSPTPADFLSTFKDDLYYYSDRILRDRKGEKEHENFAKTLRNFYKTYSCYVVECFPKGINWKEHTKSTSSLPNAPPPPPPIAGMKKLDVPNRSESGQLPDTKALFEQINQGENITSRLKKVTDAMKTKNISSDVSSRREKVPVLGKPVENLQDSNLVRKIAFENDKQWFVENVNQEKCNITIEDKRHSVYIHNCNDSHFCIVGKANTIILDSCKSVSIVFDGIVSTCEVINCKKINGQSMAELPSFSIQNTDGCQLFLSKQSQSVNIISSKSSEMNIMAQLDDSEEYTELAMPEQFVTKLEGKKLITRPSEC